MGITDAVLAVCAVPAVDVLGHAHPELEAVAAAPVRRAGVVDLLARGHGEVVLGHELLARVPPAVQEHLAKAADLLGVQVQPAAAERDAVGAGEPLGIADAQRRKDPGL